MSIREEFYDTAAQYCELWIERARLPWWRLIRRMELNEQIYRHRKGMFHVYRLTNLFRRPEEPTAKGLTHP